MSSSSTPRLPRRGFAGAAALGLLGVGASPSRVTAAEVESILKDKSKGNGPPLRVIGLGIGIKRLENTQSDAAYRFDNTNTPHEPRDPGDSVWVFAQGQNVVMTYPIPNPPKDPHHVWIWVLNDTDHDGEWPAFTKAYLVPPGDYIILDWPANSVVNLWTRPWMKPEY